MLAGAVGALLAFVGSVGAQPSAPGGRQRLELPGGALASLPASGTAAPALIVLLHGAGQGPSEMVVRFEGDPDCADAVLLAPKSRGVTWDAIAMAEMAANMVTSLSSDHLRYASSPDGERVMAAMRDLADKRATDPARQTLLGFSDGATFALALGTSRDRPFTAVVALSPGLRAVAARPARGRRVLVMHGKDDRTLAFASTDTSIVPTLRAAGLAVRFVPFRGGHTIPERPVEALRSAFADAAK